MSKIECVLFSVLILCLCAPITSAGTGTHDPFFTNISVQNGLSGRYVRCIEQDEMGFLWFGTTDGLNRYDGYDIEIFRHKESDESSLSSSNISCLLNDSKGRLWVGSSKGLDLYDYSGRCFSHVVIRNDSGVMLDNDAVRCLYEDRDGLLWIGTVEEGLVIYSPESGQCRTISFEGISGTVNRNIIRCIDEDIYGNFWVGTFDGLFKLDKVSWTPEYVDLRHDRTSTPSNNLTLSLMTVPEDSSRLWVGTETGLHLLDVCSGRFNSYSEEIVSSLSAHDIKCLEMFDDRTILVGTHYGLNLYSPETEKGEVFLHNELDRSTIANNVIWDIFRDRDGNFWFATNNGVSAILSSRLGPHLYGTDLPHVQDLIPENVVSRICFGRHGERYLSLKERVVVSYPDGSCENIPFDDDAGLMVRNLHVDHEGTLWACTTRSLWYKESSERFFRPVTDPAIHYVNFISEDSKKDLWVDTFKGVCKVGYTMDQKGRICHLQTDTLNLRSNLQDGTYISPLLIDGKDRFWGVLQDRFVYVMDSTGKVLLECDGHDDGRSLWSKVYGYVEADAVYVLSDTGVYRFDEDTRSFSFLLPQSSVSDPIHSGVADHYGNIWFASNLTLVRYEKGSGNVKFFDISDFLPEGIVWKSMQIDPDGQIWIGGFNKYLSFIPKETYVEKKHESPAISDLKVTGKSQEWRSMNGNLAKVRLHYDENSIEASYSLLDYESPASVQYSYILEGYDKHWTTVSGLNHVRYSNLTPGNYIFRVKAAFSNEIWTEATDVRIRILPPWWLSWYALLFYSIIIAGIVYYLWHSARIRLQLAEKVRLEEFRRMAQEELIQYKIRYFTNISHEFRTPLTLIVAPLDMMLEKEKRGKMRTVLKTMKDNADRLLRMVNQIMDFNKVEQGIMTLQASELDLVGFLAKVHALFLTESEARKISYSFTSEWPSYYTSFDADKLEKIVYNLLSNAFKYTPDNGSISLRVIPCHWEDSVDGVEITVSDTGPGIPQEECNAIFDRFYQSTLSDGSKGGTGIGLSLAKDFTDLFGGKIFTDHNEGPGMTFHVQLPFHMIDLSQEVNQEEEQESLPGISLKKKTILIVDDNLEMCSFMQMSLEPDYKVIIARNGEEGLMQARKSEPDIIVSDLMMPVMNGLEFCRRVKEDEMTCHIPFILLTAKDAEEDVYTGLKCGADDYIPKPFNMKLLKLRIGKILNSRDMMRMYLQRKLRFGEENEDLEKEAIADPFIDRLLSAISEQISNEKLDVGVLSTMLNMSKQQIYRKVKALMGLSIVVLIRNVRMKEASVQLVETDDNISEIMYRVGFTNTSYFSKCFTEQFGCSPSDFRKQYWQKRG